MKHNTTWPVFVPQKQEAVDLLRLYARLRHSDELPDQRVEDRVWEDWSISLVGSNPFRAAHDEWLAERARDSIFVLQECVEVSPEKLGGVPVLRGTRFSVSQLLAELADGETINGISDNYDIDEDLAARFLHALSVHLNKPAPR
jgi:uncharacterized protein (DUF433 family)